MSEDTDLIVNRLDKIIELLELRNGIERARDQMRRGCHYYSHEEIFGDPQPFSDSGCYPICNCEEHKSGESTGGWICPVHGQQF